ncbi:TonB-dependent receptor [Pseudocolwellia sp. HL-MZ19]|uniref:TonB-dependent receptor n=1 Tax=Pseudocolwellia sp. HL-MZ19 TaxID=3400846 RepID=UPI003CE7D644
MRKLSKIMSVLLAVTASAQINAEQVKGTVTNNQGKAISGAMVKIMGTNNTATTNEKGIFTLDIEPGKYELHVAASNFVHKNINVNINQDKPAELSVLLDKSAIEIIDVHATPFHTSNIESALPIIVVHGEKLRMRQENTLGDTLSKEVGVHSNFHGSVASTPIIRGLDGPRVLVTQNGLDAGDASRIGPDHAVSTETSTTQQIEVLRGPATLFYGSGAIGGVVNLVDERVPRSTDTKGEWLVEQNNNNDQTLASGSFNSGTGNIAVHADAFYRESNNYEIPERDGVYSVENSAAESSGFTLGTSYLLDNGFVGLSYQSLDQEYGIPGHSHGDEEVAVLADLEQERWQLLSELDLNNKYIKAVNTRVAYTDYEHSELEVGVVGTTFENETLEARTEILHQDFLNWRGGLSLHYKQNDFTAVGEEAFTPPSKTDSIALALMEERHFGDVLLQLGARIERTEITAGTVRLPELELFENLSDLEAHDDHGSEEVTRNFDVKHVFTPVSFSAGLVWDFTDSYNLALSLSHSKRAPSASELLSFGPHIGTGSYEVGALFSLQESAGQEAYFSLNDQPIKMETANNIDLSLRKFKGDFGFILNAFYNQIDDYYYEQATGLFAESEHDHGEEEGSDHEEEETTTLPLYAFTAQDVTLYGFEAQAVWQVNDQFSWTVQGDIIRASLDAGGDLPRTPPARIATELKYQGESISADLFINHYFDQDHVAELETSTDGYVLVDFNVNYHFSIKQQDLAIYLKGKNLTDEYAQVHTSFLKDLTPLAGRSFAIGIRGSF